MREASGIALAVSPAGHPHLVPTDVPVAAALRARVERDFVEAPFTALLDLGAREPETALPASLAFGRDLARLLVSTACKIPDLERARATLVLPAPSTELDTMLLTAPPMIGGEYLSRPVLAEWWTRLESALRESLAVFAGTVEAWLAERSPIWSVVGRVCFHLAENKASADTPFAFLATYASRVSEGAKIQHVPLGRALERSAGAKDQLLALLVPVQRAATKSACVRRLVDSGDVFRALAWTPEQAHELLREVALLEESGVVVRVPDWWKKRAARLEVTITVGGRPPGGIGAQAMLDFDVALTIDGAPFSDEEWRALRASTSGLAKLRGQWVEVDRETLEEVLGHWRTAARKARDDGVSFHDGMRMLAGVSLESKGEAALPERAAGWSRVIAGDWLAGALAGLRSPEGLGAVDPGSELRATLRPYQRAGLRWLWLLDRLGLGGCLADDMGLGKTIQLIALLLLKRREPGRRASLLVLPASLIANWIAEIARFAPTLRVFVAHPSVARGAEQPDLEALDLVITSYGTLHRLPWIATTRWDAVILDEAQAIKNPGTRQARAAKALEARTRIAVTGTPIENSLGDLWSLFDFLAPGFLGTSKAFTALTKRLGDRGPGGFGPLRDAVRPYILRRLKSDKTVIQDLPEKTEVAAFCGLSKIQAVHYQDAVTALAEQLSSVDGIRRRGVILSSILRMKQICNHPSQWLGDGVYAPEHSGKLTRLAALAEEIAARQEKVLVFSQFREMTEPLARFLEGIFGRPGLVLHGDVPVKKRKALVDAFQDERGPPFFVLSLKAGGTGLNLTAASHVIHFDRWWNPSVEDQATDRAYRIGQKRNVLVHKLVCRGTIEEKVDAMIAAKRGLSKEVLEGGSEISLTEMSDSEIMAMVQLDVAAAMAEA